MASVNHVPPSAHTIRSTIAEHSVSECECLPLTVRLIRAAGAIGVQVSISPLEAPSQRDHVAAGTGEHCSRSRRSNDNGQTRHGARRVAAYVCSQRCSSRPATSNLAAPSAIHRAHAGLGMVGGVRIVHRRHAACGSRLERDRERHGTESPRSRTRTPALGDSFARRTHRPARLAGASETTGRGATEHGSRSANIFPRGTATASCSNIAFQIPAARPPNDWRLVGFVADRRSNRVGRDVRRSDHRLDDDDERAMRWRVGRRTAGLNPSPPGGCGRLSPYS